MFEVQSFISKELHNLLFLEEFVFANNKFSTATSTEREFADAVVLLGDTLIICQIKQRDLENAGDADAERRWFESKVLRHATKQIRDTLGYLRESSTIRVPNERGHYFDLARNAHKEVVKIIIYLASPNLPQDCRRVTHHLSKSAGYIHIVEAHDYLAIAKTLRVPLEVIRYFKYREVVTLQLAADESIHLPEAAIAGHFIGGDPDLSPSIASAAFLHNLIQDETEWDLAPFLRGLHENLSAPGIRDDYYEILIELAKLPRSAWRVLKERIVLCVDKTQKGQFTLPYRVVVPETGCGFVLVPADKELVQLPDWESIKLRGLQNLVQAHKYDQRLSKCVGVLVAKDGETFTFDWCLVAHEWTEDPDMQRALDDNFPFRPVREAEVHGYKLIEH